MKTPIVRLLLTGVLIFFAYQETGPSTTLLFVLIAAHTEVSGLLFRRISKKLADMPRPNPPKEGTNNEQG